MNSEWQEFKVADIAIDVPNSMSTGPFGSAISSKYFQDDGVPVIRGGNLSTDITNRMSDDGLVFVSYEKAKEFYRSIVRPGDLVFTCWGTINQVGLITEELEYSEYIISNKQMKLTPDPEKVDSLYLYYLFSSPLKQAEILSNGIGAAVPGFNLGQLKNHTVYLPPLNVQKRISSILNSFDEKIRSNNQTNQTLEQIAQAIFKSWFVDFEPVKAKIAAKQNGQDPELAAMCAISGKTEEQLKELGDEALQQLKATAVLFPEALVESELGEIPEGWEVKSLSKIIEVIGGGTPKRSEDSYWNGDIPWFSVKDAPNMSDIFVVDTIEKISDLGLQKSSTKLLTVGTTIITARGTVGKLALVGTPMCMNQSCYGIRGLEGVGPYFNYFNLREAITTLQKNTHGAVFDTITTQTFESYSMPVSTGELIHRFDVLVTPVLKKIEFNSREVTNLSKVRDALIPKLISGEIELNDNQNMEVA